VKTLLVVYHTRGVKTAQMAQALERGALAALKEADAEGEVRVVVKRCADAGPGDVLDADAIALGTPENFGYMSGAMKDFFDRTFYPVAGRIQSLPYAIFISAGNDGTGAIRAIRRIANGYPLQEVQEPIVARGDVTAEVLARCRDLGMTLAAGLEAGIY